ncbi:ATP-binding protein [Streptomyces sp. IB2014 016-6]|uniref:ATP-binding protein n=1 Tax=Streptomyces sp. IB2014 016-6 TaxID=2517818 RepID=UPI0011C714A3|nr:ATP-binding protein [Streptomyces sp. IB2014 016-6]TXL90881.1 ATP-binding protein [Streptomyces sp. IB2014 016-6]
MNPTDPTHPADPRPEGAGRADDRPADGADRPNPWLSHPAPARTVELISGDFLITVNPVDGSEIEPCPPGSQPPTPVRLDADERAEQRRAGRPPIPAGPGAPPFPLLERQEERERLVGLLGRGHSVRLTGSAGSGRTALLEAVAADCEELAPDGVVRLSGHHRTVTELLYELYAAVYRSVLHRPDRAGLLGLVRGIGAVVVLDDLEFGGDPLDELLEAAPECAFLLAVTPDVDAPISRSRLEEVLLGGLGRAASLDLLERATGRPLTDEEANWAGDLWFESEGLPQRFVQAGALLRGRDSLRAGPGAYEADGVFVHELDDVPYGQGQGQSPSERDGLTADGQHDVPLPTLGEGAAPAVLLASRLSEAARETLRFAVALGGEVPHQAHLPALVGDTHADAAVGELMNAGLLSPVGPRYRLAAGALAQLEAQGYGVEATSRAHTAVQHFTWWAGHPSVTPRRAASEADALLAAMTPLVSSGEPGHASAAVLLARGAAPAFMAGLHWGAWERALRIGQEAARIAGEVAEEAYFHHELGILALCVGRLDRARAELETSISMRGAVADKRGTVSGRRALALVSDRENGNTPAAFRKADAEPSVSPSRGVSMVVPVLKPPSPDERLTLVTRRDDTPAAGAPTGASSARRRRPVLGGARRNLVAAGAGAVLAAVLGTVVTLGASGNDTPTDRVQTDHSADDDGTGYDTETPADASTEKPAEPGAVPGTTSSGAPTPATSGGSESQDPGDSPSDDPSEPDDEPDPSDPDPDPTDSDPDPDPTDSSPSPSTPTSPPPSTPTSPPPTSTTPAPPPESATVGVPVEPTSAAPSDSATTESTTGTTGSTGTTDGADATSPVI